MGLSILFPTAAVNRQTFACPRSKHRYQVAFYAADGLKIVLMF